jgi:hypothetical protein
MRGRNFTYQAVQKTGATSVELVSRTAYAHNLKVVTTQFGAKILTDKTIYTSNQNTLHKFRLQYFVKGK